MARRFTDRAVFDGETLTGTWTAPDGATAVTVKLSDGAKNAEVAATANGDGTWTATATAETLAGFSGATRWIVYATTASGTEAIACGAVYIRPLVSKYRAVVAAVETALQNYGNDPNKTITVGELSITYKDYADLLSILAYWRRRADEDETGQPPKANGPKFAKVRFV
jgi:hypothetical protein